MPDEPTRSAILALWRAQERLEDKVLRRIYTLYYFISALLFAVGLISFWIGTHV